MIHEVGASHHLDEKGKIVYTVYTLDEQGKRLQTFEFKNQKMQKQKFDQLLRDLLSAIESATPTEIPGTLEGFEY